MILLEWCGRCMRGAGGDDYDITPDPACRQCAGTGYVPAGRVSVRRYWAEVSQQTPPQRALVASAADG